MIIAVLQARFSSSRLPGKILKALLDRPMISRQMERIKRARRIDELVLATSVSPSDDPVADLCAKEGIACFRGSLDDVLDRFYQAVKDRKPDHVVRLTGDCPLADPAVIDSVVDFASGGNFDYASNAFPPTFPDGLDVEVIRFSALEEAWKKAALGSEREHVTPYFRTHPGFKVGNLTNGVDLSAMRWTVDDPADYEFVKAVYQRLYARNPAFSMNDVLTLLKSDPAIAAINAGGVRNAGYQASLAKDAKRAGGGE